MVSSPSRIGSTISCATRSPVLYVLGFVGILSFVLTQRVAFLFASYRPWNCIRNQYSFGRCRCNQGGRERPTGTALDCKDIHGGRTRTRPAHPIANNRASRSCKGPQGEESAQEQEKVNEPINRCFHGTAISTFKVRIARKSELFRDRFTVRFHNYNEKERLMIYLRPFY